MHSIPNTLRQTCVPCCLAKTRSSSHGQQIKPETYRSCSQHLLKSTCIAKVNKKKGTSCIGILFDFVIGRDAKYSETERERQLDEVTLSPLMQIKLSQIAALENLRHFAAINLLLWGKK